MRLVILHISDIHFKTTTSLKPAAAVAACLREIPDQIDHVIVVITGDIAFSGKADEYETFSPFIEQLRTEIKAIAKHDPQVLTIPGNHDCMHPDDTSLRDIVLKAICDNNGVAGSPQLVEQAVSVQSNYFAWASANPVEPHHPTNKTTWVVRTSGPSGERIAFLCINSAWMSTLHESQGKLFLPLSDLPSPDSDDVVISLLHHPYNWFESNNARAVRQHLEAVSDIILTGHEHDLTVYTKTTDTGGTEYVEGGLFHSDAQPEHSAFCIIRIDLARKEYGTSRYYWTPGGYRGSSLATKPFVRSAHKQVPHVLCPDLKDFLKDIGAQLTHPSKTIEFYDVYITPSLRQYIKLGGGEGLFQQIIESEQTISTVFSEKVVYFAGDGQSGKTSLAKHLFNCALERGLLPVYIKGERLKDSSAQALQSMLRKEFESQYSHPGFDDVLQMPPNRKLAIIDDLPDSRLNRQAKAKALEWLRSRFDYVFVFGGDLSHIEEMLADMEHGQLVAEMAHFEIVDLGYVLRSRLIEKWITLGATSNYDQESLAHKVSGVERLIDTVLGKNLLPAHPIFILSMLQQLETNTSVNTKSGAYGYLYEVLITTALNRTSRSVDEIDTKYTYLSEFAWYLRCQKARECDREEMDQFNEQHRKNYRLPQAPTRLCQDVIESRVLVQHGSRIGFRYKYLYYYFLARYIRDNISEPDATSAVDECIRDLHREECANVVIFLTYLSRDRALMQKLLDSARDIFRGVPPCDLESHVEFLNKLDSAIPNIFLPDSDPATKEEVLRQQDLQHQSR